MSAHYFLPYLRRGVSRELDGWSQSALTVALEVGWQAAPIEASLRLLGAQDVRGIPRGEIGRMEPPPGTLDHDVAGFATLELRAPELPWLLSPQSPAGGRLPPWIALVVVEDREGVTLAPRQGKKAGRLDIQDRAGEELGDLSESWAWAHVQVTLEAPLQDAQDRAALPERLDAGAGRARLICPRRLESGKRYHACLVPTLRRGALAGLGEDPAGSLAAPAWAANAGAVSLPVYHAWSFTTGEQGDFRSLARRLRPVEAASVPGLGIRELDLSEPIELSYLGSEGERGAYIGVLRPPSDSPPEVPEPSFKASLRARVQLGMAALRCKADDPDPVVAPPAYGLYPVAAGGAWPERLSEGPAWFQDLNLHPTWRAAAGVGAQAVQQDQEALMAEAWDQAQQAREAAKLRRAAEAGRLLQGRQQQRLLSSDALDGLDLVQLLGPSLDALPGEGGRSVRQAVRESDVPDALLSPVARRAARPSSSVGRGLDRRIWRQSGEDRDAVASLKMAPPARRALSHVVAETQARTLKAGAALRFAELRAPSGLATSDEDDDGPEALPDVDVQPFTVQSQVARALAASDDIARRRDAALEQLGADGLWVEPRFTDAFCQRVDALDPELLLPGVGGLDPDSVTLLQVEPRTLEAMLAGANHEMARELLWREFPADLHGSFFLHFWEGRDAPDCAPLREWAGALGSHGALSAPLVFLVRGALLRRFPGTRVSLWEATWSQGRRVPKRSGAQRAPVMGGRLGGDARFYGFDVADLGVAGLRGSEDPSAGPPGWFVVFEEEPGALRFGPGTPDAQAPSHAGEAAESWRLKPVRFAIHASGMLP